MTAKTTKGQSTRQRILDSAAGLVYQRGVNATSVDDILRASGTGKSQFYHYFKNKDALTTELVSYLAASLTACRKDLLDQLNSRSGIENWLAAFLNDYRAGKYTHGCPMANMAGEAAGNGRDEAMRTALQAIFARWEDALARGIRTMRHKGELRSDCEPDQMALFMISAVEGALVLAKTDRSPMPVEATIDQLKKWLAFVSIGGAGRGAARLTPRKTSSIGFCP